MRTRTALQALGLALLGGYYALDLAGLVDPTRNVDLGIHVASVGLLAGTQLKGNTLFVVAIVLGMALFALGFLAMLSTFS